MSKASRANNPGWWKNKGEPEYEYGLEIRWTPEAAKEEKATVTRSYYDNQAIRNTTEGRMKKSERVKSVKRIKRKKKS